MSLVDTKQELNRSTEAGQARRRELCNVCDDPRTLQDASETARIKCNVRKFADRRFGVWRCGNCRSIHSTDVVDLAPYYKDYPFQRQQADFAWRLIARNYVRRLKRAGFTRGHSLLDYGCGSGLLINRLSAQGYLDVHGFDAYTEAFADRGSLQRTYDFVVLQDVIEHVEEPAELLDEVVALTAPGGAIVIGTPNADELDLRTPHNYVHSLHQPYHLHVLSAPALRDLAQARGLAVEGFYSVYYCDTFVPFATLRFCTHYARLFDDTLDLAFDPYRFTWRLLTPKALLLAFLGHLRPPRTEMMFVFRKPA